MKIHVTGGSGFTGGFVIRELRGRGHEVFALARSEAAARRVEELGATPVEGDLDDERSVLPAFEHGSPDGLINVASLGFGHAGTIVNSAEAAGLKRAVFVSTTAIFTRLEAQSRAVRLEGERRVQESNLDWTILRPTMIYGTPADRNIARLLEVLRRTPIFPLPGGGEGLQQPVHVEDLAHSIVTAYERDIAVGQEYEVAGPEPITFRQLVDEAASALGRDPVLVRVPLRPVASVMRLYERMVDNPRIKEEQILRLAEDKAFDIAAAQRDLDFSPRSFSVGIRQEAELLK